MQTQNPSLQPNKPSVQTQNPMGLAQEPSPTQNQNPAQPSWIPNPWPMHGAYTPSPEILCSAAVHGGAGDFSGDSNRCVRQRVVSSYVFRRPKSIYDVRFLKFNCFIIFLLIGTFMCLGAIVLAFSSILVCMALRRGVR